MRKYALSPRRALEQELRHTDPAGHRTGRRGLREAAGRGRPRRAGRQWRRLKARLPLAAAQPAAAVGVWGRAAPNPEAGGGWCRCAASGAGRRMRGAAAALPPARSQPAPEEEERQREERPHS